MHTMPTTQIKGVVVFCLAAVFRFANPVSAEELQGRVVDRASLAGAPQAQGISGVKLGLFNAAGKRLAVKTTSKSGHYRFGGLRPGTYTVTLQRASYLPELATHTYSLAAGDTLSRDVYLDGRWDKIVKSKHPLKTGTPDAYARLAAGMLETVGHPEFFRESVEGDRAPLSRFFDPEADTSASFRRLWVALLWTEIESQNRPVTGKVRLAQALDTVLKNAGWPELPALKPYLVLQPDSLDHLSLAMRAWIGARRKKSGPETWNAFHVPNAWVVTMAAECLRMRGFSLAKRKAFALAVRKVYGSSATQGFAEILSPPKIRGAMGNQHVGDQHVDALESAFKQVVLQQTVGKNPNPVAIYHLGRRRFEAGKFREALSPLGRSLELRPEYSDARYLKAQAEAALEDTAAARRDFELLSQSEAMHWQARAWQGLGNLCWQAGQAAEAEQALWRSMGVDSKSNAARQALYLLAEISLTRDSSVAVEALLDSLVRQRPREAEAYFWLGKLSLQRHQDGVATDYFRKAVALVPGKLDYAEALAQTFFGRDECAPALLALKPVRTRLSAHGLEMYGQCLLNEGKTAEANREFEKRYSTQPSGTGLALWARGLIQSGHPEQAVRRIAASPKASDPEVRRVLADAWLAQESPAEARQILEALQPGRETDPDLHFALGRCAMLERKYEQASSELTQALRYRTDYPSALFQQGLCLLKQNRPGEAHTYFQELADQEAMAWKTKGWLGQGMAFFQEGKLEAAQENLSRSFQGAPGPEAAAHLALVALRMNKADEAVPWVAKARKLDPGNYLTVMAAVELFQAQGQNAAATSLADAGLVKHPESCDFLVIAAKAHLRDGNDTKTRELSEQANNRCPTEAAPYFYLGAVSARAGSAEEAKRHFDAYVRAGGDLKSVPQGYR